MRISDWSSDVCSSDLSGAGLRRRDAGLARGDDPRRADGGGRVVPVAAGGDPDRVLRRARRRRIADRAGRAAAVLIAVSLVAAPARSPTPPPIQYPAVGRRGGGPARKTVV